MSQDDRDRWEARYRDGEIVRRDPDPFVLALDGVLPRRGRALDVAGGRGRHALWLARRGLDVLLTDISETALGLARAEAAQAGVHLDTLAIDLEEEPVPPGPWDVILSFHYLQRSLFAQWPMLLSPGGLLVFGHPTRTNLERHARPPERFLLEDGELATLVQGLEVERLEEGWTEEGRYEARLLGRCKLAA